MVLVGLQLWGQLGFFSPPVHPTPNPLPNSPDLPTEQPFEGVLANPPPGVCVCTQLRGWILQEGKGTSVFTGWLPSFSVNSRLGSRSQRGSRQALRQTLRQTLGLRDRALGATILCSSLSFQYHVPGPLLLGSPVPLIHPPQAHLLCAGTRSQPFSALGPLRAHLSCSTRLYSPASTLPHVNECICYT